MFVITSNHSQSYILVTLCSREYQSLEDEVQQLKALQESLDAAQQDVAQATVFTGPSS